MTEHVKNTGCCDPFDPSSWKDKTISWHDKLFVTDRVTSFLHMPLNMGGKMAKNMKMIEEAGAKSPDMLMLSDENSLWGCDIYVDVTKNVPGAKMAKISGTFLTKVFEGPYSNIGKWMKEMTEYTASKNHNLKKIYFYYTACPKCAKAYNKNYVVLLAQVD
jgi:hypothetical protein